MLRRTTASARSCRCMSASGVLLVAAGAELSFAWLAMGESLSGWLGGAATAEYPRGCEVIESDRIHQAVYIEPVSSHVEGPSSRSRRRLKGRMSIHTVDM